MWNGFCTDCRYLVHILQIFIKRFLISTKLVKLTMLGHCGFIICDIYALRLESLCLHIREKEDASLLYTELAFTEYIKET